VNLSILLWLRRNPHHWIERQASARKGVSLIYGHDRSSRAQRATIIVAETVFAGVALWILLLGGIETVGSWFGFTGAVALPFRRLVLFLFVVVTYVRMTLMITVLLKRNVGWEEAVAVPLAFFLYYVVLSVLGGLRAAPFGALDGVALALFASGATANTLSELLRHRWKRDPRNQGKLYTGGLFRYSRHVNYFGDILWVSGWALFTRNPWSAIIPALLFCMFAFYNVPLLDRHLAAKYASEFQAYRRGTKGLIPFVF
jgi:protein-S-isoprenylcysteine O-methyltransferase Ste14